MSAEDDASVPTHEKPESADESAATGGELTEKEEPQKHEESTMIDVHAPQGGIHTWRDFWIHLGTIALGLLIAIGLEQSAEWIHHLHQRHQLEEDLRGEGVNNQRHAQIDIALYDKIIVWLLDLQHGVDAARATGGKTPFVYPARPDGIPDSSRYVAYHVLQTEVWTTAKESSLLVLLPRAEAQVYARLYIQSDQVQSTRDRARDMGMQQGAFESRFSHGMYPPDIDPSKLTPQQMDEYEKVLTDELESVRIARVRLKIFAAANDYVLAGGQIESDLRNAILKANVSQ